MERMLNLLMNLGEVKNYSLRGRSDLRFPPVILVWYWRTRAEAVNELARAVASYRGRVEWCVQAIPGGWAVTPKRLPELVAERSLPGFLSAPEILADEEPTFAELAHLDLDSLADHVSRSVE